MNQKYTLLLIALAFATTRSAEVAEINSEITVGVPIKDRLLNILLITIERTAILEERELHGRRR